MPLLVMNMAGAVGRVRRCILSLFLFFVALDRQN